MSLLEYRAYTHIKKVLMLYVIEEKKSLPIYEISGGEREEVSY